MRPVLIGILTLSTACAEARGRAPGAQPSQAPPGFWDHWGDGQAEVAGYHLTFPRYGQQRTGEAVLVTVTETMTAGQMVKSDGGHADEMPVLKLNSVVDFGTGVYDYNTLTSTFLRLDGGLPRGAPARITFSMQEWCGAVHDKLVARDGGYARDLDSYFDGESVTDARLDRPSGAVAEDALPVLLRGLTGRPPEGPVRLLPRLMDARLHHDPLTWQDATITPGDAVDLETPAGTLRAVPWTVSAEGGPTRTWYVGADAPHVIAGWDGDDGERARLSGVLRTRYWQATREGAEAMRADLGLPPRVTTGG